MVSGLERISTWSKNAVSCCPTLSSGRLLFQAPEPSTSRCQTKWNEAKQLFFVELIQAAAADPKLGGSCAGSPTSRKWPPPLPSSRESADAPPRYAGGREFGPHVFDIAEQLGREETQRRSNTHWGCWLRTRHPRDGTTGLT